jgi:Tol biopolymer transport system component
VSDHGDGFDLYVAGTRGGTPERVVLLDGDERSPSWTPDGRLVFAHRASGSTQWDLFMIDPEAPDEERIPLRLTQSLDDEIEPHVSPDGRRVAFRIEPRQRGRRLRHLDDAPPRSQRARRNRRPRSRGASLRTSPDTTAIPRGRPMAPAWRTSACVTASARHGWWASSR